MECMVATCEALGIEEKVKEEVEKQGSFGAGL